MTMKRAILVGAGTVAGVAAVLGYHPGTLFSPATAQAADTAAATGGSAQAGTTTDAGGSTSTTADAGTTAAAKTATAKKKTYTGDAVQTRYGTVQVTATVKGSTITDVTAIASPNGDGQSARISAYAIPQLQQQAVAAQSASISGVSGASYTSQGFEQSLQSALAQAGLA
jgi:uncharacterized protein with FMN-binding domain